MEKTLEELYNLQKNEVDLIRVQTKSGRWLELFKSPGQVIVIEWTTEELTSLCPRTGHPDFCELSVKYIPDKWCLELKSAKYYIGSFRNEGHFYEELISLIYEDFMESLSPVMLEVTGTFNTRGGMVEEVIACSPRKSDPLKL